MILLAHGNLTESYPRSLAKRRRSYLKLMSYFKSLSYLYFLTKN